MARARWWFAFLTSVLILPVAPTLVVMGVGWLFPGKVPWFYADAAVPIGPLLSVSAVTSLLIRARTAAVLRIGAFGSIVFCLSFIARSELVMAKACVSQRGAEINFQQQLRDWRAADGQSCDGPL